LAAACVSDVVKKRWTVSSGWVLWLARLKIRAPSSSASAPASLRASVTSWVFPPIVRRTVADSRHRLSFNPIDSATRRSTPLSEESDLETTTMPISPLFRVCDGVRIRFADNKADSSAVTVLMLSPWPESLWAFRRIWDRVSGAARVVAIDLPGFGHSDGRPELIAPDAMGTFLARLIEEWGLGAPHVVGPDVGTAAALFLAANAPARVTSLTIGGGAVRVPIDAGGALKDVIEAPSLDVVRQLDARTNIGLAVEPVAGADSEPGVHEDYVSAYDLGRFAESARFVRHYPEQNPVLRDLLPSITTPAQIIAGREDDLVPWSNNEYLADLLPNSEIHPLDAGHFAWEQAPDEYGRLLVEWVTGGFQRLGGTGTA
jgi:pimeloyl-ACP methyl ester carboxylesterase